MKLLHRRKHIWLRGKKGTGMSYIPETADKCGDCTHEFEVAIEPEKFEHGDLVIIDRGYGGELCTYSELQPNKLHRVRCLTADHSWPHISPKHIKQLETGSVFTAGCIKSIFAKGMGEFVMMDTASPYKDCLFIDMGNGKHRGEVWKCSRGLWALKPDCNPIVLPSIASGWWDREIAPGVWVRCYETANEKLHAVKYSSHPENPFYYWNLGDENLLVDTLNAINPPIIPLILRQLENNGEMTSPPSKPTRKDS